MINSNFPSSKSITSSDISGALGYTPYDSANPSGYITSSGSITGTAANVTETVAITNGGTGATTVAGARNALGLGNTSGALPVANGGTGATSAASALTNLGAAAASHNHGAGNITSGTLAVARGGTGIATNPSMLTNLGTTSAASVFATSPRPGVTGTLGIGNGGTGATTAANARSALGAAPTASPAFTGTPTAPTAAIGTNNTQIATTAFVKNQNYISNNSCNGSVILRPGSVLVDAAAGVSIFDQLLLKNCDGIYVFYIELSNASSARTPIQYYRSMPFLTFSPDCIGKKIKCTCFNIGYPSYSSYPETWLYFDTCYYSNGPVIEYQLSFGFGYGMERSEQYKTFDVWTIAENTRQTDPYNGIHLGWYYMSYLRASSSHYGSSYITKLWIEE